VSINGEQTGGFSVQAVATSRVSMCVTGGNISKCYKRQPATKIGPHGRAGGKPSTAAEAPPLPPPPSLPPAGVLPHRHENGQAALQVGEGVGVVMRQVDPVSGGPRQRQGEGEGVVGATPPAPDAVGIVGHTAAGVMPPHTLVAGGCSTQVQ
jgi:hypothetical protein